MYGYKNKHLILSEFIKAQVKGGNVTHLPFEEFCKMFENPLGIGQYITHLEIEGYFHFSEIDKVLMLSITEKGISAAMNQHFKVLQDEVSTKRVIDITVGFTGFAAMIVAIIALVKPNEPDKTIQQRLLQLEQEIKETKTNNILQKKHSEDTAIHFRPSPKK